MYLPETKILPPRTKQFVTGEFTLWGSMCHSSLHWEECTVIFRWLEGFHFILLASSWVFLRPGYITSYEKCLSNGPNGVPKKRAMDSGWTQPKKLQMLVDLCSKQHSFNCVQYMDFPPTHRVCGFCKAYVCGTYLIIYVNTQILYNIKSLLLLVLIIMYIYIYYNSFSETLAFWLNGSNFSQKRLDPKMAGDLFWEEPRAGAFGRMLPTTDAEGTRLIPATPQKGDGVWVPETLPRCSCRNLGWGRHTSCLVSSPLLV